MQVRGKLHAYSVEIFHTKKASRFFDGLPPPLMSICTVIPLCVEDLPHTALQQREALRVLPIILGLSASAILAYMHRLPIHCASKPCESLGGTRSLYGPRSRAGCSATRRTAPNSWRGFDASCTNSMPYTSAHQSTDPSSEASRNIDSDVEVVASV